MCTARNVNVCGVDMVLRTLQTIHRESVERENNMLPQKESQGPVTFKVAEKISLEQRGPRRRRGRTKTNTLWYYGIQEKTPLKKRAANAQNVSES